MPLGVYVTKRMKFRIDEELAVPRKLFDEQTSPPRDCHLLPACTDIAFFCF